jgi:hypothetical protein
VFRLRTALKRLFRPASARWYESACIGDYKETAFIGESKEPINRKEDGRFPPLFEKKGIHRLIFYEAAE